MGIIMAICELETQNALCKDKKLELIKVRLDSLDGFEDLAEFDKVVDIPTAKGSIDDWEGFLKRNRLTDDIQAVYLDKIKKDEDLRVLEPLADKVYNGWVDLRQVPEGRRDQVVSVADKENRLTAWDMVSFDEMNETCSRCTLSWDKGRGCIGAFGPENSLLPEIASRRGCPTIASVFDGVKEHRLYSPQDAVSLLSEVEKLKKELPEEGKMMVRRYDGVLDRIQAMARVCSSEGCHFCFF